jgi:phosphoglycerol transferase MdoB-like AlkP superfamily enzyme
MNDFKDHQKFYFLGGSASWANIRGFLLNNINGLDLYEEGRFKSPAADVWGISDKNLFLEAHEVLKKQTKPFFAVIQTSGNHRPYTIPEEDLKEFKKIEFPVDSLRHNGFDNNDELNAFRYSDYCFQKFIEAAKKEKYFNNTLFVFVGDHGILGNPGNLFKKTWVEGDLTREHVPLLFYAPAMIKSQLYSGPCSQLDVLPSIAGVLGLPYTNTAMGRNLFQPSLRNDSSMISQSAFRYNAEKNEVSLILNNYYYELKMATNTDKLMYLHSNDKVPVTAETNQIKAQARELTKAIFETSKYMLLNNKKK